MEYNKEQRLAIEKRGGKIKNILVSAGAGSGKTAVLTERVVKLVCDENSGVDIDRLLIMTFTKNAASEMRERIEDKLKQQYASLAFTDNIKKINHIKKQISLLNRANITTIDSFCNNIVRQYFYKAGVDPAYKIAGDDSCRELVKLKNSAIDELFLIKFEVKDNDFLMLLDFFCPEGINTEKIKDIFFELDNFLSSVPFPEKWLESALNIYKTKGEEVLSDDMRSFLSEYMQNMGVIGEETLTKALLLINETRENYAYNAEITSNKKLDVYENAVAATAELLDKCMYACADYDRLYNIFKSSLPSLRGGSRNNPPELEPVFDAVKKYRDTFKRKFWDKLKEIFAYEPESVKNTVKKHYRIIKALFGLYTEYTKLYREKKDEISVLSFADINRLCIKVLIDEDGNPSAEALEYRNRFDEVIVDEYQDNNMLQEYILNAVTYNKDNLFMVGDIKQSIYKFRHACPDIFAGKYKSFNKKELTEGDICICLNTNYRSRKSILDTVNFAFYQLMRSDFGGIDYNEEDALKTGADYHDKDNPNITMQNEVIICSKNIISDNDNYYADIQKNTEYYEEDNDIEELEKGEAEAHIIAQRIIEMTDKKDPFYIYDSDTGKYRPCILSDIAILMRSANTDGGIYSSVLNRYGIDTVSNSRYSLFDELEIKTIMSLLKVLDNPYRDKELITVLHSPIFNISCEELVKIKLIDKKGAMYDNIIKFLNESTADAGIKQKLERYIYINNRVSAMNAHKPFFEVLDSIYVLTDYINYIGMIKNGDMRIENLRLLSDMAKEIYDSGITDFSGIVKQLCETEKEMPMYDGATEVKPINAVRIMSIHKSKGLEFPIVFIAQLNKDIMRMRNEKNVIIDMDMGIAFNDFDVKTRIKTPFINRTVLSELKKSSSFAEELRLLYVALTRAKEKLIMVGSVKDIDKAENMWQEYSNYSKEGVRLPIYAINNAKSYLDWLMIAYERKNVFNESMAKSGIEPIDIDEILKISIISSGEINTDEYDTQRIKAVYDSIDPRDASSDEKERLDKILLLDYLDKTAAVMPSKISVSEAKRQRQIAEYERLEHDISSLGAPSAEDIIKALTVNKEKDTAFVFDDPAFLSEEKTILYGAQRGTAYHTVFEHLKFNADSDLDCVKAQLEKLLEQNILSTAEFNSVSPDKFIAFLNSPLGKRACASDNVYREIPFVMRMSPYDVFVEGRYGYTDAGLLVHGIVDLYFEEDDGIVLVDYKTDKIDSINTKQNLCEKYKIQLEFYKRAIELSSGKHVKQMYLYFVSADEEALVAEYIN